jgi:hypothetical protein
VRPMNRAPHTAATASERTRVSFDVMYPSYGGPGGLGRAG